MLQQHSQSIFPNPPQQGADMFKTSLQNTAVALKHYLLENSPSKAMYLAWFLILTEHGEDRRDTPT